MNIHKLKHNPKKLKKLNNNQLMELFQLSNQELKSIMENASKEELENFENQEVNSWESFIEEVSELLDSRE